MQNGSMRIELKPDTIDRLEDLTGEKMTTRCDKVINMALDMAEENEEEQEQEARVKMMPELLGVLKTG